MIKIGFNITVDTRKCSDIKNKTISKLVEKSKRNPRKSI